MLIMVLELLRSYSACVFDLVDIHSESSWSLKYNLSLQVYLFLGFWLINRDIDVDLENILVLLMLESDGVHVLKEEEVWND